MLKNIVYGTPILFGAVVVAPIEEPPKPAEDISANYKCKPTDLPLYTPLHDKNTPKNVPHKVSKVRSTIEEGVRVVRTEVTYGCKAITAQKKNVENFVATGIAHSQSTIDYLNQPDNTLPRVGAIAIGGASGLILAVRGGFIRKILYTGIGAGGIASLCYPKEAEKFAHQGLVETKKGIAVAYNFIKGVKPNDKGSIDPFTGFPTSLNDLKEMLGDMASSAKDSIFSNKK